MKKETKIEPPVFDSEGYQTNIKSINGEPLPDLSSREWRHFHGGARAGAGRKPTGRNPLTIRLSPPVERRLRAAAKRDGVSVSDVAERMLAGV